MTRVVLGCPRRAKHKKWLKKASGYFGRASKCYKIARRQVERGMRHAVMHRRKNHSRMRSLWITRINAAARQNSISYSRFMRLLRDSQCQWNRKTLAECAVRNPDNFKNLVSDLVLSSGAPLSQ